MCLSIRYEYFPSKLFKWASITDLMMFLRTIGEPGSWNLEKHHEISNGSKSHLKSLLVKYSYLMGKHIFMYIPNETKAQ